jgi:hypothetical protein
MTKQPTKAFVTFRMQLAQIPILFWNTVDPVVTLRWVRNKKEREIERERDKKSVNKE